MGDLAADLRSKSAFESFPSVLPLLAALVMTVNARGQVRKSHCSDVISQKLNFMLLHSGFPAHDNLSVKVKILEIVDRSVDRRFERQTRRDVMGPKEGKCRRRFEFRRQATRIPLQILLLLLKPPSSCAPLCTISQFPLVQRRSITMSADHC